MKNNRLILLKIYIIILIYKSIYIYMRIIINFNIKVVVVESKKTQEIYKYENKMDNICLSN